MSSPHVAPDQADMLRQMAGRAKVRGMVPQERLGLRDDLRVISVTSGKGGVGKSSVVINLAASLAASGKRVLIIDSNPGMGDICLRLGQDTHFRFSRVLSGELTLEQALIEVGGGISILPAGVEMQQYSALTPSERNSLLKGMLRLEHRFDYFLIDTGSGVAANVTSFAAIAKEILLVVTPEPTSIMDAYALVKTLSGRDSTLKLKLLVNMCREAQEGAALFAKLSTITGRFLQLSMEYAGCILHDEMIMESVRRRGALCCLYPEAKGSLGFRNLAKNLMSQGATEAVSMQPHNPVAARPWRNHELSS